MSVCCDPSGYRRMFDERHARRNADTYRRSGLEGMARGLVDHLRTCGLSGLTVLEIGGGVGGIQIELLRAGAAHAMNVELSPEYEGIAAELAREAGVADRVERRVGDFVDIANSVEPADVVVMHRVVCCYPYLERLLGPAADRARRALALTFPRRNPLIRAALGIGNVWFWATRSSFRLFAHPPREIDRIATERGLGETYRKRGFFWESVVFERAATVSG